MLCLSLYWGSCESADFSVLYQFYCTIKCCSVLLSSILPRIEMNEWFWIVFFYRCCKMFCCCRKKEFSSRTVFIGTGNGKDGQHQFPANVIRNQKYSVFSFIPIVSILTSKRDLFDILLAFTIFDSSIIGHSYPKIAIDLKSKMFQTRRYIYPLIYFEILLTFNIHWRKTL